MQIFHVFPVGYDTYNNVWYWEQDKKAGAAITGNARNLCLFV